MRHELLAIATAYVAACGGPVQVEPDPAFVAPDGAAPSVGTATEVFVGIPDKLYVFDATADGEATPLRSFRSANRPFSRMTSIQTSGGEVFICEQHTIQVFDVLTDSDGAVPTKRLIEGPDSQVNCHGMAVYGGEIYETGTGGILLVHELEASFAAPPLRKIFGSGEYHWLEVVGSEIYAASSTSIEVHPIDADGPSMPTRTIRNIELEQIRSFHVANGELFVVNGDDTKLRVFDAAANGVTEPLRVLKGLPAGLVTPQVVGTELFVGHNGTSFETPATTSYSVFDVTAADFASPLRRVTFPNRVSSIHAR